jgi:hypothetical protein
MDHHTGLLLADLPRGPGDRIRSVATGEVYQILWRGGQWALSPCRGFERSGASPEYLPSLAQALFFPYTPIQRYTPQHRVTT